MITQPYMISNEFNMQEVIRHFDTNMIFHTLEDKIENFDFAATLPQANIVKSFEDQFAYMTEEYPGDAQNIRSIRLAVYTEIIQVLTAKFNLQYNVNDESIDLYKAALYLYDFLIANRNKYIIDFFTAYIVNNKDSIYNSLQIEGIKKTRDISSNYGKMVYNDPKYNIISASMPKVLNMIREIDIRLENIFSSIYPDITLAAFMSNAFGEKGNFFNEAFCSLLDRPDIVPILIVNIKLNLQKYVGLMINDPMGDVMKLSNS